MSRRTPTLRDEILLALDRPKAEAADRIVGIVEREKAEALEEAADDLRKIAPAWICDLIRGIAVSVRARATSLRANQGGDRP